MSSQRLENATEFLNNFATLDMHTLAPLLSESYSHIFRPSSIQVPGPFDKAGFLNHMNGLKPFMIGFPVYVTEIIESESSNAVWAWCTSATQFKDEVKDRESTWNFRGEYVFMFWMDGEGKVRRCVEMLDSKATGELMGLMSRARANLEKVKDEGK